MVFIYLLHPLTTFRIYYREKSDFIGSDGVFPFKYIDNVISEMDPFTHFSCKCQSQKIVVLGEGNFSFARGLVTTCAERVSVVATSFDCQEKIYEDTIGYSNVEALNDAPNSTVFHNIDATKLEVQFPGEVFCKVIFNFPHVGGKSNIKECRRLLHEFFKSSRNVLCSHGDIVVLLCKGQGGTPADKPRRLFKDSWMVSSQAAKAGLNLTKCVPFESVGLQYTQAGYRGQLKRSFLISGGLIHILDIGLPLSERVTMTENDSIEANITSTDLQCFNKFSFLMESTFMKFPLFLNCFKDKQTHYFKTPYEFHHHANAIGRDCVFNFFTLDKALRIVPYSNQPGHHTAFVINMEKGIVVSESIVSSVIDFLQAKISHLQLQQVVCVCDDSYQPFCRCLTGEQPFCYLPSTVSPVPDYDVNSLPSYTCDVPQSFWIRQTPDICISSSEHCNNNKVVYKTCPYTDYKLNSIEKSYFNVWKNTTGSHAATTDHCPAFKLAVNGVCIASLVTDCDKLVFVIHTNAMLYAVYNVPDSRYLRSKDEMFKKHLIDVLAKDLELEQLYHESIHWDVHIPYQLCYRHDLCFWLDEKHSENDLLTAVRYICSDLMYAVRLLKVLRHEESDCISYCYRMLYSRVDGPLSHADTVAKQNELRLYMLDKGFQLR